MCSIAAGKVCEVRLIRFDLVLECVLCGNHIGRLIKQRIGVSVFRKGAYMLKENACYTDSETATGSYTETI